MKNKVKVLICIVLSVGLPVIFFFNLGKYLDVTQQPLKADIIVCLGGGSLERIQKAGLLYEEGYATKDALLLVGDAEANIEYMRTYKPELGFVFDLEPENTGEEIYAVKRYMKAHGYKQALIVTHPSHSRRVSLLTSLISVEGDEEMSFRVIDSGVTWWDEERYYQNEIGRNAAMSEAVKLVYNFIGYGILEKAGLLDEVKSWVMNYRAAHEEEK